MCVGMSCSCQKCSVGCSSICLSSYGCCTSRMLIQWKWLCSTMKLIFVFYVPLRALSKSRFFVNGNLLYQQDLVFGSCRACVLHHACKFFVSFRIWMMCTVLVGLVSKSRLWVGKWWLLLRIAAWCVSGLTAIAACRCDFLLCICCFGGCMYVASLHGADCLWFGIRCSCQFW